MVTKVMSFISRVAIAHLSWWAKSSLEKTNSQQQCSLSWSLTVCVERERETNVIKQPIFYHFFLVKWWYILELYWWCMLMLTNNSTTCKFSNSTLTRHSQFSINRVSKRFWSTFETFQLEVNLWYYSYNQKPDLVQNHSPETHLVSIKKVAQPSTIRLYLHTVGLELKKIA